MDDLSIKKCVPCSAKELRPMTEEAAHHLIRQVPEWNLVNEGGMWKLHRSWKVKTFMRGMEFFQLIAAVAEAQGSSIKQEAVASQLNICLLVGEHGHHPDLHLVGWNKVKIDIWTHAVGGLTENDFILAAKINKLNLYPLLRIEVANE